MLFSPGFLDGAEKWDKRQSKILAAEYNKISKLRNFL